jgi:2-keto-3-deoxy-L-rhamnonate aldolase RhmA
MGHNGTRERLMRGEPAVGCFLRQPDAGLTELLALHGLDFVVFDGEHGTLSPQLCEHLVRAAELHGVTPAVRVEENRAASIMRYLDTGVLVCHVPGVNSSEEAIRAVRSVKFTPRGNRGLSASRAARFGVQGDYPGFIAKANRETLVVAHIESVAGVDAVEEIAAVDGLDVLLFGALDLSHDLGCPGEVGTPRVAAAGERIFAACDAAGKAFGVVVGDATGASAWMDRGARYILTTLEALIAPGLQSYVGLMRR